MICLLVNRFYVVKASDPQKHSEESNALLYFAKHYCQILNSYNLHHLQKYLS